MMFGDDVITKIFRSEDFGYEADATPETKEREFYFAALSKELEKLTDERTADSLKYLASEATISTGVIAFRHGIRFTLSFLFQAMVQQGPSDADHGGRVNAFPPKLNCFFTYPLPFPLKLNSGHLVKPTAISCVCSPWWILYVVFVR